MSQHHQKPALYYLTEGQKEYLQSFLPRKYCFRLKESLLIDVKRNRTPKKMDDQIYETPSFKKKFPHKTEKESSSKNVSEEVSQHQKNQASSKIKNISQDKVKKFENALPSKSDGSAPVHVNQRKPNKQIQNPSKSQHNGGQNIDKSEKQAKKNPKKGSNKTQGDSTHEKEIAMKPPIVDQNQHNQVQIQGKQSEENGRKNKDRYFQICDNNPFVNNCNRCLTSIEKQYCQRFVQKLKAFKSSWPFRLPVDPVNQGVPDYLNVIKEPMDLKTIQKKIAANKYQNVQQFKGDINKIFLNSYKFNPKQTNFFKLATQLQGYYHQLLKECENDPGVLLSASKKKFHQPKIEKDEEIDFIEQQECTLSNKKKKTTGGNAQTPQKKQWKQQGLKLADKIKMGEKISTLESEHLEQILFLIYESEGKKVEQTQMVFSIRLEELSEKALKAVDQYLKKQASQSKVKLHKRSLEIF